MFCFHFFFPSLYLQVSSMARRQSCLSCQYLPVLAGSTKRSLEFSKKKPRRRESKYNLLSKVTFGWTGRSNSLQCENDDDEEEKVSSRARRRTAKCKKYTVLVNKQCLTSQQTEVGKPEQVRCGSDSPELPVRLIGHCCCWCLGFVLLFICYADCKFVRIQYDKF